MGRVARSRLAELEATEEISMSVSSESTAMNSTAARIGIGDVTSVHFPLPLWTICHLLEL